MKTRLTTLILSTWRSTRLRLQCPIIHSEAHTFLTASVIPVNLSRVTRCFPWVIPQSVSPLSFHLCLVSCLCAWNISKWIQNWILSHWKKDDHVRKRGLNCLFVPIPLYLWERVKNSSLFIHSLPVDQNITRENKKLLLPWHKWFWWLQRQRSFDLYKCCALLMS